MKSIREYLIKIFNIFLTIKYEYFFKETTTAYFQHEILLRKYVSNTVSAFMKRDTFERVGGFDESIEMLEDYPMWLKLTLSGVKIYFMEEITTYYRIHDQSVSAGGVANMTKIIPPIYYYNLLVQQRYIMPYVSMLEKITIGYMILITKLFMNSSLNRKTRINNLFWKVLIFPQKSTAKMILCNIYKKISK